jgi:glutamine synthetase type III
MTSREGVANGRYRAVSEASSRCVRQCELPRDTAGKPLPVSEYFGCNTFNFAAMERHLPSDVFRKLVETVKNGSRLDMDIAGAVAHGMKEWAMSRDSGYGTGPNQQTLPRAGDDRRGRTKMIGRKMDG